MPATAKLAFAELHGHMRVAAARITELEARIVDHARHDDTARRLATIPGIGPITASLIAATVGDNIGALKSARHFAAWLGLVPRQFSTGGKTRLGRITKAGNSEVRRRLVIGATAMAFRAAQWNSAAGVWIRGVLERCPMRLATVALANKMARIVARQSGCDERDNQDESPWSRRMDDCRGATVRQGDSCRARQSG